MFDRAGVERLVLFSGLYPIRSSISEDDGATWTPLRPIGEFGGIVAMGSVVELQSGEYAAFFHDDGRFFRGAGKRTGFTVYQTRSPDGGLSWGEPTVVVAHPRMHLCEPGVIRSPDGRRARDAAAREFAAVPVADRLLRRRGRDVVGATRAADDARR